MNKILQNISFIYVLLSCFLQPLSCMEPVDNYGLYFISHTAVSEQRTCLNLTPSRPLSLKNGFILDFDLALRQETHNYGYIARIIINDTLNVDIISNVGYGKSPISVIKGNEPSISIQTTDSIRGFSLDKWLPVSIKLDYKKQRILFDINGYGQEANAVLPKMKKVNIIFGRVDYGSFSSTDVPPMSVRNVCIRQCTGKRLLYWPLRLHGSNTPIVCCFHPMRRRGG